jgi:hypothetical protein
VSLGALDVGDVGALPIHARNNIANVRVITTNHPHRVTSGRVHSVKKQAMNGDRLAQRSTPACFLTTKLLKDQRDDQTG